MKIEEKIIEIQKKLLVYPDSDELKIQLKRLMTEQKDLKRIASEFGCQSSESGVRSLEPAGLIPDVVAVNEKQSPKIVQESKENQFWKKVFNGSNNFKESELSDRLLELKIADDHTSALNIIFRAVYDGDLIENQNEDGFFLHTYKLYGNYEKI